MDVAGSRARRKANEQRTKLGHRYPLAAEGPGESDGHPHGVGGGEGSVPDRHRVRVVRLFDDRHLGHRRSR